MSLKRIINKIHFKTVLGKSHINSHFYHIQGANKLLVTPEALFFELLWPIRNTN